MQAVAFQLLVEIVDRRNNYLPAYFVMNELFKLSQIYQHTPTPIPQHRAFTIAVMHEVGMNRIEDESFQRLSEAIQEVFDSFRPLARVVSVEGRWMLSPVAAHRGLMGSGNWRLDLHSFRYVVKGSLPYAPEDLAPQSFLLYTLISQPRGKDLVTSTLFGRDIRRSGQTAATLSEYVALCLLDGCEAEERCGPKTTAYRWLYLASIFAGSILSQASSSLPSSLSRHAVNGSRR